MIFRRILILSFFLVGLFAALPAQAALTCPKLPEGVSAQTIEAKWISVQVPIPGVTTPCTDEKGTQRDYIQDVGAYIGGLYKFLSGAIGIIATVMVFWGGIRWVTAAGNPSGIKDAKEIIFSALIAVVISLGSYLLLYVINPNLVNLRPPTLVLVKPIEQRYANCSNVQHCQSGPKQGQACATSAECGGAPGSGICRFDVDVGTDSAPKCGKEYSYIGEGAGTTTCQGSVCFDDFGNIQTNDVCTLGVQDGDTFKPNSVEGTTWGCASPELACEAISDNSKGVGVGVHPELCRGLSVDKVGKCGWWDESFYTIAADRCVWRPVLKCQDGYERVGCGECNDPNGDGNFDDKVSCPNRQVDSDSLVSPFLLLVQLQAMAKIFSFNQSMCTVSAGVDVYSLDMLDKDTPSAICCRNIADPTKHYCNAG